MDGTPTRGQRLRRRDLIGLAAGAVLLATGAWTWAAPGEVLRTNIGVVPAAPSPAPPSPAPSSPAPTSPAPSSPAPPAAAASSAAVPGAVAVPGAAVPPPTTTTVTPVFGFEPERMSIPAIDVDSRVVPVGVGDGGELGVPEDPEVFGWWDGGAKPGIGRGSVVLDGHVDSSEYGRGPLHRAVELRPGDTAWVVRADGRRVDYVVTAVQTLVKQELPTEELFRYDVAERLILITCGGEYRRGHGGWDSNVIVHFAPA